ncbi:MAG: hypothetical protein ACLP8A_05760 [Methylovirgula sp.]
MSIYRLDPINPGDPSWQNSAEKDCVWAGAATPKEARDLVATKTNTGGHTGAKSPWQDESVTSCVLEPTMSHIAAGTVVRADGSQIG